jgi:hypothetical protein
MATAAAAGVLPSQNARAATSAAKTPLEHPMPSGISRAKHRLLAAVRERLRFQLFSDGTAVVEDQKNGAEWRFGAVAFQEESVLDEGSVWLRTERSICEQYPGRFAGKPEGEGYRFWVLDTEGQSRGSFHVDIVFDGDAIEWRIPQIDAALPCLSFPAAVACESLVLPQHVGRWVRMPLRERHCWPFFSRMNMRWFGGLRGENCYLAILPGEQCADALISATEMAAAPMWLQRLGEWKGEQRIRYEFLRGNYVDLAKAYRAWAKANGLHRSLEEKLRATPALASLTGGRLISCMQAEPAESSSYFEDRLTAPSDDALSRFRIHLSHSQAAQVLNELPGAGVARALLVLRGWIHGGYDWSHPDIWPPDERLGTLAELHGLCTAEGPITVGLHDNYQDIYRHNPSWPHGINRTERQRLLRGGYWDGGQAYILNAAAGLSYARRNWKMVRQLSAKAIFIDTTSAVQTYQSWEPGRLQHRAEDLANKKNLLSFFKECGVVLGSEEGADFAIPYLDWCENRHEREPGESIPIWPLVFHDAIVSCRYTADPIPRGFDDSPADKGYPRWLLDMLWGYAPLTQLENFEQRAKTYERIRATRHVSAWFAANATDSMDEHAFINSDRTLERTQFSSKRSIIVNFAPEPQACDGRMIPAHGYAAFDEQGEALTL